MEASCWSCYTPLDVRSEEGVEFLCAAREGRVDDVLRLLRSNATLVGARDASAQTALHLACIAGQVDVCDALLEHDCDRNARDDRGNAPLHCAALSGHLHCVQALLNPGTNQVADLHALNQACRSSFANACWRGHSAIAKFMHECGARINECDENGHTPAALARAWNHAELADWCDSLGDNMK